MSWTDDTIFRRSESGDQEIRERKLKLAKMEQIALVSVDGVSTVEVLLAQFDGQAKLEFQQALASLCKQALIDPLAQLHMGGGHASVDDEFFTSSMEGLDSGSGLVVDTHSNSMRSVRGKLEPAEDEVDLFIPLEGPATSKSSKTKRVKKLVEVYPEPKPRKKKRKKKELPPENKWIMRAYIGLVVLGVIAIVIAVLMS